MQLNGRRVIMTDIADINAGNIVPMLQKAMETHELNRAEIDYLWKYYKGEQPILKRTKKVRKDICNRIVVNRANEIVSFKVGYLCGEPIQYVGTRGEEAVSAGVAQLNDMMSSEGKARKDQQIVEWQMVCGTAYRIVLPDRIHAPFEMYTLDPRSTFVVYDNTFRHNKVAGCVYTIDEDDVVTYTVYTRTDFYKIRDDKIIEHTPHFFGRVPIFEYPANSSRVGAFEPVITLLDAINTVESNRVDGIEQFVQAFVKFINCDITSDDFEELKESGAFKVMSVDGLPADVEMMASELNQTQTQTAIDDMYQTVLTICGIPNRNGGSSTSDTGQAVVLRDGWSLAEACAKSSETVFKASETEMLDFVIEILHDASSAPPEAKRLHISDISPRFTRRNYENILMKAQVLTLMLSSDKIHPRLAFTLCNAFPDAESAYAESMAYYEEILRKQAAELDRMDMVTGDEAG